MAKRLFSTTEIAGIFDTTRQSVNDWIRAGVFDNVQRVGRNYAVPVSDVLGYLDVRISGLEDEVNRLTEIKLKVAEKALTG